MRKNLESRLDQLERLADDSRELPPGMVYFFDNQTFEEAAAEYEQQHGFKLPDDAPVIQFVAYDARKKAETIDQD